MRKSVISVLAIAGALAATPAFAVPIVPNNVRPVAIGPSGAEPTLQSQLDALFGPGVDAINDQSASGMWGFTTALGSTIPTVAFEFAGGAGSQVFGIWWGSDTSSIFGVDLFNGSAVAGTAAGVTISGNTITVFGADCISVACQVTSNALINTGAFGFYLRTGGGATYYTVDQLNGGTARALAYQAGGGSDWLVAFEDGSDFDYNDMGVKIESLRAVPEPGSLLLLGSGLFGLAAMARRRRRQTV